MRKPRSRRALLTSLSGLSLGIAGCFEGTLTGSDEALDSGVVPKDMYDCSDVERPEPPTPEREGALEPASYPVRPESLLEAADEYVREFEAAYRRNAFIKEYDSETADFEFEFDAGMKKTVESESDRDAVLVSIVYHLTEQARQTTEETERYTRVTYYIDEDIMLRARYDGVADGPEFEPNPRSEGDPVACFG